MIWSFTKFLSLPTPLSQLAMATLWLTLICASGQEMVQRVSNKIFILLDKHTHLSIKLTLTLQQWHWQIPQKMELIFIQRALCKQQGMTHTQFHLIYSFKWSQHIIQTPRIWVITAKPIILTSRLLCWIVVEAALSNKSPLKVPRITATSCGLRGRYSDLLKFGLVVT